MRSRRNVNVDEENHAVIIIIATDIEKTGRWPRFFSHSSLVIETKATNLRDSLITAVVRAPKAFRTHLAVGGVGGYDSYMLSALHDLSWGEILRQHQDATKGCRGDGTPPPGSRKVDSGAVVTSGQSP